MSMNSSLFKWKSPLSIALIACGTAAIIVAVKPELVGRGGQPGFSVKQIMLAAAGAICILGGIVIASPAVRRYIKTSLTAVTHGERLKPARVLLISIWFGLFAGLGEVAIRGIQRFVLWSHPPLLNPNMFWMAPLADAALVSVFALLLVLVAHRWRGLLTLRIVIFVFGFLGFLSVSLLFYPEIHGLAVFVLAAGLTIQTCRLIASHPDRFYSLVRRTVPYLIASVAALGLCVGGYFRVPEMLAHLPPAREDAPNVLLIVLDTARAQNLSLYGYHRETTPRLERFAKTGVRFDRALSPSSYTLESHASMFTGEFPHKLFAARQTPSDSRTPLDGRYETLAEALSSRGYTTAGFVANLVYTSYEHGLNRGFTHYEDYVISLEGFVWSSSLGREIYRKFRNLIGNYQSHERKTAADVNRAFLSWLRRHEHRPFFVFLNYFDAHDPYIPAEPFKRVFGPKNSSNPGVDPAHKYTSERIEEFRDAYDNCILNLDYEIGSLLDQLQAQGQLKNTLIIITSDHGELFGEHGLISHGNGLYRPLLHVPLLISFPARVPAGQRVREPVSLRDLPATVMDLAGFAEQVPFRGASLARYWNGGGSRSDIQAETHLSELLVGAKKVEWWPEWFPVYKGSMKSLVGRGFHYIKNGDGSEELYDFDGDPLEEYDLSGTVKGKQVIEQMRQSLAKTTEPG